MRLIQWAPIAGLCAAIAFIPSANATDIKQIENVGTKKCLDVPSGNTADHVKIQQYTCRWSAGDPLRNIQQWELTPIRGHTQFRNVRTGKCLDVPNLSVDNKVKIQQYQCRNSSDVLVFAQLWDINPVGGKLQIRSVASGKCLDIPSGSTNNHVLVQQYTCRQGSDPWFIKAQAWTIK